MQMARVNLHLLERHVESMESLKDRVGVADVRFHLGMSLADTRRVVGAAVKVSATNPLKAHLSVTLRSVRSPLLWQVRP